MTLHNAIDSICTPLLPLYGEREALSLAVMVVGELYGVSRIDIALEPLREVGKEAELRHIVAQLIQGRPIQYVLGTAEFCGLSFVVREGVLIPRPETEELVAWILDDAAGKSDLRVLDIGTGSGCIAVSLAHKMPMSCVYGVDISSDALAVACENALKIGVEVDFLIADALSPVESWDESVRASKFDVIVSNPPYIPQSDRESMCINVKEYEPSLALMVPDDDILKFYRAIACHAKTLLKEGGLLYFEIYEKASEITCAMLRDEGFRDAISRKDIHSRERMVRCRK